MLLGVGLRGGKVGSGVDSGCQCWSAGYEGVVRAEGGDARSGCAREVRGEGGLEVGSAGGVCGRGFYRAEVEDLEVASESHQFMDKMAGEFISREIELS